MIWILFNFSHVAAQRFDRMEPARPHTRWYINIFNIGQGVCESNKNDGTWAVQHCNESRIERSRLRVDGEAVVVRCCSRHDVHCAEQRDDSRGGRMALVLLGVTRWS